MSLTVYRAAIAAAAALGLAATTAFAQSDLEQRVDRLEQRLEGSALMALMNEADALRSEVTVLRGEIEILERELGDIRGQQRSLYLDLDERLQALENGPSESADDDRDAPSFDTNLNTPEAPVSDNQGPSEKTDPDAIRSAYDEAFSELRNGNYGRSAEQFEAFLETYADADLAANARYWLGESHYVQRDFAKALSEFQRVLEDHPDSNKRPDAMLKIGYVRLEQDQREMAQEALEAVIEEHPNTTAANLAQQRLDQF